MRRIEDEVRRRRAKVAARILEATAQWIDVEALDRHKILEIGGGPIPVCTFFRAPGVAIDPLAAFYRQEFQSFLDLKRFAYLGAMGEALPFRTAAFRLVVCDNVLEHVLSVPVLLEEVRRVSEDDATVYIRVDLYPLRWNVVRSMLTLCGVPHNVHHPHCLRRSELEAGIRRAKMDVLRSEHKPRYRTGWKRIFDLVLGTNQEAEYVVGPRGAKDASGR